MFTTIQNRYKKNLANELNFLSERIEIDGLKPEHDVRLAAYFIDALKFAQGVKKLRTNKLGFPKNELFSKTLDHGIFFNIIYNKIHDYKKSPSKKKLQDIANCLAISEKENLYPRLENDVEDQIYADIIKSKTLMQPNSIIRLTKTFYASNQEFMDKLNLVSNVNKFNLTTKTDYRKFEEAIDFFSESHSFLELLMFHPIQDLKTEKFLTNLRRTYLQNFKIIKFNSKHHKVLNSLGLQNFINEYIFSVSVEEKRLLEGLEKELITEKNVDDNKLLRLMIFACYRELPEFKNDDHVNNFPKIKQIHLMHVEQKFMEQRLREKIPSYLKLKDKISEAVKSQYEVNPYPRWESIHVPHKKHALGDWLCQYSSRFKNTEITKVKFPNVLVAGTGTGQQSIGSALTFSKCNVDAIDLSKSSLSYALRKSRELGVKNINFMQADLFEIDFLEVKYDLIQCSGVLHHTSDPLAGLKSIKSKLLDHGVIQLGLYSRFARFDLNKVRNYIAENSIGSDKQEMLGFREKLLKSSSFKNEVLALSRWGDFFTTSMFRDLCFHEHEIQYDCSDLQKLIDEAGLEFVGMMLSKQKKEEYQRITGKNAVDADLDDWYEFELKNTSFFAEMYNFFVKPIC